MYENLIYRLTIDPKLQSIPMERRKLLDEAANAIRVLVKHDAEVDEIARQACEIRTALGCKTMDELVELVRDGRVLVLPCKVGDTVYRINYISQNEIGVARYVVGISETKFRLLLLDEYGKTVFLTREETEDALKERTG